MRRKERLQRDAECIKRLGGATKVAAMLPPEDGKPVSVQRVTNWMTRGIPAQVKLDNQEIFLAKQVFSDPSV